MIQVRVDQNKIRANGHAGYAPKGYDIVCAAFSALSLTLEIAVKKLTNDDVKIVFQDGIMQAEWEELSFEGDLLVNAYIEGVKSLAENYPEYIIVQARNT